MTSPVTEAGLAAALAVAAWLRTGMAKRERAAAARVRLRRSFIERSSLDRLRRHGRRVSEIGPPGWGRREAWVPARRWSLLWSGRGAKGDRRVGWLPLILVTCDWRSRL